MVKWEALSEFGDLFGYTFTSCNLLYHRRTALVSGLLLITTCLLLAYEYWFGQAKVSLPRIISRRFRVNQIIGVLGSLVILIFIVLAFFNSNYELFRSEILIKADHFRFEILPMDIVRLSNLSGRVRTVEDIEVSLVMIVYIFLILGATISLISSLVKSRIFKGIGSILVFTGLVLFLVWLPQIAKTEFCFVRFRDIIGLLGLGWYISMVGMSLIVISSLFQLKPINPNI